MKLQGKRVAWSIACLAAASACAGSKKPEAAAVAEPVSPPYFGQSPPGTTPALFAPGVVNTGAIELNGVFTPDGREFFFTRMIDGVHTIFRAVVADGAWSELRPLEVYADGARALAVDMAVSPDGNELYFLGEHSHEHAVGKPGYDLWVSRKVGGDWTTAQVVPPPVSTTAAELYPVVVADGSLYFTSNRPGGDSPNALYRAQRHADGGFDEPVKVAAPIDSEHGIGDSFIAPDESFVVFSSRRPPSFGNGDLFVSFRGPDGDWGEPESLGAGINTDQHEFCPMMTPDGKFLFFSRRWGATWDETTESEIFWVDARILEPFRRL